MSRKEKRVEAQVSKNRMLLIIVIIILLLIAALVWKFIEINKNKDNNQKGIILDSSASNKKNEEKKESVSEGVAIPGWKSITIDSKTDTASVDFINPQQNSEKFYLSFELVLKSTGETLYKSDMVEPGKTISKINISKHLSVGEYQGKVKVQPYRIEDGTTTNNAEVSVKLIVK